VSDEGEQVRVTLVGVDPGVVDTALVVLTFDNEEKTWSVFSQTWTGVSEMRKENFIIKQSFLDGIAARVADVRKRHKNTKVAVEGYRNRGNNMRQDQQMTLLVREIAKAVKGEVVDNTGVKNVVKPAFLNSFNFQFARTNHRDLESAARIALKLGLKDDAINKVLSDYLLAHLLDEPWRRV
jgi:hypothetical protein